MIYNIIVSMEINADSKKEAEQRVKNLFTYIMRVERRELGLEDWTLISNETTSDCSGCRDNHNK